MDIASAAYETSKLFKCRLELFLSKIVFIGSNNIKSFSCDLAIMKSLFITLAFGEPRRNIFTEDVGRKIVIQINLTS